MIKVIGYQIRDVVRSRWLIAYALFFLLATDALLRFGGADAKALLSLSNVVLLVIPLVALVFGTMHVYNAREFTELLLAQPVGRRELFGGLYLGLAIPLSAAFALGVGVPVFVHGASVGELGASAAALVSIGVALSFVFTALAFYLAIRIQDKSRGLGAAIALWLGLAVLYDGLVLLLVSLFADYPIERPLLGAMVGNPVDLARVMLLLRFDVSALMGYTGAVFKNFFGGSGGLAVAVIALALWVTVPTWLGVRAFQRKDF
ncbi:MAG TPA: ABC transporter permease subunit [Gemmatimonadaceae bacterium]|jgi:Cu-processing system permease protein|nr:ABC transporter permease subunit [Gemmatimonadaceae bacterium]